MEAVKAEHFIQSQHAPAFGVEPSITDQQRPLEWERPDKTVTITNCGRICMGKKKINVTSVLGGQNVGITQTDDHIWLVTFMNFDLGYFDETSCRLEPIDNPFNKKLYNMSQV